MSLRQPSLRSSAPLLLAVGAMLELWAAAAEPLAAQTPDVAPAQQLAQAVRIPTGEDIRIDGSLHEAAWALAQPLTKFRVKEPTEGGVPSEASEIRLVYDSRALYIGAMFHDSEPEGILAHQLARDAGLGTDDRFMWILDTFGDGRTGYFFEINPAGLMGDGLIGGGGHLNKRWDGIWEVRTRILPDGWSAEIRIPFSTLNFDPAREAWGINFQRTIRRRNEEILWSGWRRNEGLFRPANAGQLRGVSGISQGVGIELKPYVLGSGHHAVAAGAPWDGTVKTGMDITYSLTPSLRAAVSLNTDFAEVEVDQRRVNITRFPLRFPEQREFFLEGSGVFSFRWADPFFSRRIGLVEGQEVPIRYGVRLGGQAGRYELGLYQVRTGETVLDAGDGSIRPWAAEDFTVGRVKRSLFHQSHVGAVYTRRASGLTAGGIGPADRHTIGTDFDLYTSRVFGRYNAQMEGFMLYHTDPVEGGDLFSPRRRSRGLRWDFPNDLIRLHTSYRDFGDDWDPAVGFSQRNGFRRYQPTLTFAPRPQRWASVRQTEHEVAFEYLTDMNHRLLTRNLDFTFLRVNFESGDLFSIGAGQGFERLDLPFTIHGEGDDAIRIDPGDYEAWTTRLRAQTAGRRMLSGSAAFERGDFWGGRRTNLELSGTVRPSRGVSLSADYERNIVRLPQGDFNTNLVRGSWAWNLSPLASMTGSVQYDDVSNFVGLFAHARWILRPGRDIFLVWTHNWQQVSDPEMPHLDRGFRTLSRSGALKANYSYRF